MRYIPLVAALSTLALAASAGAGESVLLASGRGGWIEAIDLRTLETVSRIRVPEMTESVASDTSVVSGCTSAPPTRHDAARDCNGHSERPVVARGSRK